MSNIRIVENRRVGIGTARALLIAMMKASGKDVGDIAFAVDRDPSTVYRWIRGEHAMSADEMVSVAAECGCQIVVEITQREI